MTRVGIGLPGESVADVRAAAFAASHHEFDSFSVYGDLGDLPPYSVLQASADRLRGAAINRVGPMGIAVGMQHPELTAVQAVALEEDLPGHTSLGLVRGAFLESIGEKPATLARLKESVEVARRVFAERELDIPIYLGGFGPKLLAMAGRLGVNGVKLGGSTNVDLAIKAREIIDNPDVSIVLGAVSVIDDDRKAARARARLEVSKYLKVVGKLDTTLEGDDAESLRMFTERFNANDPTAGQAISDSLLDKFALAGTADDALNALAPMNGIVDRFEFGTPHGLRSRSEGIQHIGETVLSELGTVR